MGGVPYKGLGMHAHIEEMAPWIGLLDDYFRRLSDQHRSTDSKGMIQNHPSLDAALFADEDAPGVWAPILHVRAAETLPWVFPITGGR